MPIFLLISKEPTSHKVDTPDGPKDENKDMCCEKLRFCSDVLERFTGKKELQVDELNKRLTEAKKLNKKMEKGLKQKVSLLRRDLAQHWVLLQKV